MGYFKKGFVFTSAPNWEAIAAICPSKVSLRGYKHETLEIWMLDAWTGDSEDRWFFSGKYPNTAIFPEAPRPFDDTVGVLMEVSDMLDHPFDYCATSALEDASALSVATNAECFVFLSDDESYNLAGVVRKGIFSRVLSNQYPLRMEYASGKFVLTPWVDPEEKTNVMDVWGAKKNVLNSKNAFYRDIQDRVEMAAPCECEAVIDSAAVELWPYGSAEKIAGLGTWDPFDNFEDDFKLVFSQDAIPQPKPKPLPETRQVKPKAPISPPALALPSVLTESILPARNRLVYILIALLAGFWGLHNMYAGHKGKGVAQLMLTNGILVVIVFLWNVNYAIIGGIGMLVVYLWALSDIFTVRRDGQGKDLRWSFLPA